jgi:uncharacterized protein
LDDGRGGTITSLPYVNADNTVRIGTTTDNLVGILGFAFMAYRIQPIAATPPIFTYASRPVVPGYGTGTNLKIASFNVLNYFNGNGTGGGFPTERGAHSLAEFNRQRDKIIAAITQINADVVGLIEIENQDLNDATPALLDLVNGLNNVLGAGTYSFIDDDLNNDGVQDSNTDLIRCAIIYKPSVVTPVGGALLSPNNVFDRPPLVQTFNLISNNTKFNFIVNHFKSKSGTGTGLDADQNDGQAAFNNRRKLQAGALVSFINTTVTPTSGTDRTISVGDYNAYYEEDPMDSLRAANYTVASTASSYSYLFDGQIGSLDHAVLSASIAPTLTSIAKWNANAAEPTYLSYEDAINDGGGDEVNPWASTYTASPWRASDHDAVVLGFNLAQTLPVTIINFSAVKESNRSKISWTTTQEINSKEFVIERSANGTTWQAIAKIAATGNSSNTNNYQVIDQNPLKGNNLYRLKSVDADNKVTLSATRRVNFDNRFTYSIYPNPASDYLQITTDNATGSYTTVQILNSQSQVLLTKQLTGAQPSTLHISALNAGVYFIRIVASDGSVEVQKFTKQ